MSAAGCSATAPTALSITSSDAAVLSTAEHCTQTPIIVSTTLSAPQPLSAMSADASNAVLFPPRHCADFVVHYADTDFHVHELVLQHHSAYFRAYFDTLPPALHSPSTAPSRKRVKRCSASTDSVDCSSSPAANDTVSCNHPLIAHCIHLPQQTTLVGQRAVTAADFDLFLRHLYFSSHYCYPPFLPQTDVDLAAHPPPLSLSFPPIPSVNWTTKSPLRFADAEGKVLGFALNESLLALAHYFDCAQLMAQCEGVLLTQAESKDRPWREKQSWQFLPHCDMYHMERAKKAYIGIAAAVSGLVQSAEFKSAKLTWDKTLVMEVMEAALERRK